MTRTIAALLVTSSLLVVACGDDADPAGTGGGSSGSTTSASNSSSSGSGSTSSTSSSSASQGGGGAGGDGGGGGGTGGAGGDGGGGGSPAEATFAASWSIQVGPEEVDCFYLGAEEVELTLTLAGEEPVIATLDCHDGEGEVGPLPVGEYEVGAVLLDFEGAVVAESELASASLSEDPSPLTVSFAEPGARATATWAIEDDGAPSTCEAMGAARGELLLANLETGRLYGDTFDCELLGGTGPYVPLGTYEAIVSLLYEQDVVLVSSDPMEVSLVEPDAVVALPLVTFEVP